MANIVDTHAEQRDAGQQFLAAIAFLYPSQGGGSTSTMDQRSGRSSCPREADVIGDGAQLPPHTLLKRWFYSIGCSVSA